MKDLPHKTEAGAVRLGLESTEAVADAVKRMKADVTAFNANAVTDTFLVEAMVAAPGAELMVSIRRDPQFGLAMTLAAGAAGSDAPAPAGVASPPQPASTSMLAALSATAAAKPRRVFIRVILISFFGSTDTTVKR